MHFIKKYLIILLFIMFQAFISLEGHNNTIRNEKKVAINNHKISKSEIETIENIKQCTKNFSNNSDSVPLIGKKWMLEQNIIIGY